MSEPNTDVILLPLQASGSQNNAQNVNVSQNVSQTGAPQQQGANGLAGALGGTPGATVTHHHYHLLNHGGGAEVLAALGVGGAEQVTHCLGAVGQLP